ncbi:methyl-accepting chemotaxis protein [Devosia sp.]|jgi:methyl-accepting chemotaxis protein|uniref:methyl-accepting chemotaxis protein n=1 Tax=Devosia sp. TaxID=1871048 RepID=UPI002DDD8BBB|nr:methyl-accepting chemotaxis protein [Devosia sp.]
MMRRLARTIAAIVIGAVPLAGGLYLGSQTTAQIDAAQREADGVRYAGLVLPELVGLARDGALPAADPALAAAARSGDATFGTASLSRAYDALKAELGAGAHPAAARQAATMLVQRIHDSSGLSADPKAEQLLEVPQAANAAPLSPALMQATRYAVAVQPAELARLEEVLAEFRAATAEGDATAAGKAYTTAATALADQVATGIAAIPDAKARSAFDWAGLDAAHDAFQDAALALGQSSGADMRQVLEQRIAEAGARLNWIGGVSAVLALLVGVSAWFGLGRLGQRWIKEASLSSAAGMSGDAGHESRGDMGARMATTSSQGKGGLTLTTTISAMVFLAVTVAIATVLFAVWTMLAANTRDTADQRLAADLRIAAAILEVNLPNSDIFWNEAGELEKIEAKAMPKFRNHDLIDTIGRVTGDTATLFVFDAQTQDFIRKSTTILDDKGERILETPLARDGAAYPVVVAGGTYQGEANVLGVPYYAIYRPIQNLNNEVIGLVYVGIPKAEIDATASEGLQLLALVGAVAVLVIGALSVFAASRLMRPVPALSKSMRLVASGDLETAIPYTKLGNEIGAMARNIEVFRANALKVQELTEDERLALEQRRAERAEMMQSLQQSFGDVVDAATSGDFSRRVATRFADEELNRLAGSVNTLVETVERIIGDTGAALAALADTDLTHRIEGGYEGALGQLRDDTNEVAEKLSQIVMTLKQTSRSLKTATGEILSGANDLSERTTRQAATIEETSAAMTLLADTVRANAEKAEDARHVAEDVSRTAEAGGAVMQQANVAMERITQSSAKISNIIGMIDDIAFQTNLLALNASVEAARAGEAGKGFAVVAVEVRRLAQSAAQASSEVKVLIEQSGAEVKGGTKLVAEAADKLETMLTSARRSNALMAAIAADSRQQAGSIDEVNAAVRQLDEMTQHNAALVEEINAAIEQTEAQAGEVDGIADIFTVEPSAGGQRSRAA